MRLLDQQQESAAQVWVYFIEDSWSSKKAYSCIFLTIVIHWFFIASINQAQSLVETGNSKAQAQVCAHTRTYTLYAKWLHDLQFNA